MDQGEIVAWFSDHDSAEFEAENMKRIWSELFEFYVGFVNEQFIVVKKLKNNSYPSKS